MLKGRVPALIRAQSIFYTLLSSPWPLGISELARDLSLSKSTVHGLVHTMKDMGLLEFESEQGHGLRPSRTVLSLWREALLKGSLARSAGPLLSVFAERHNMTLLAGVFLHGRVLAVAVVQAPEFSISAYPGQMVPAWAGALGKVLLAGLPLERSKGLVNGMCAHGPLKPSDYEAEVQETIKRGVAFDREEYLQGVRALAAPIEPSGPLELMGAVWAVGLAPALSDQRMEELAPEIINLANAIGREADGMERKTMGLKIKKSDVFRATLADNCGNVGFIGLSGDGAAYHVVVPVDYQIARGVKARNRPTDGTPFGGYHGWHYYECHPFPDSGAVTREDQTQKNAEVLTAWAARLGIKILVDD